MDFYYYILVFWVLATPANGQQNESIRELCRLAASGTYLSVFDEHRQAEKLLDHLKTQRQTLKKAIVEQRKSYEKKRTEASESDYNVAKQRSMLAARDHVTNIESELKNLDAAIEKTEKEKALFGKRAEELREKIKKVFIIETLKTDPQKTYPFTLKYKSSCPKYRYTCPLPKDEAYALAEVFPKEDVGEPCRSYASFSIGMLRRRN